MTRADALVLLIWCVPLASKLVREGLDAELNREDRITLNGYKRVLEAGLLQNPVIYRLTGLSRNDIENLTTKVRLENGPKTAPVAPEIMAAAPLDQNAELSQLAEVKELFLDERYSEVLDKLYPLAAAYPNNIEIQTLINQSLRARREPSKLTIAAEVKPEKPALFPRLPLFPKGKGHAQVDEQAAPVRLTSQTLP